MQSTLVDTGAAGIHPRTTLYVGGLEDNVTEAILRAAFIPFGELKDVTVPLDHATGKHRGFGFVQFEEKEDAEDAIDNMNNAELYGRVLKVNFAQPTRIKGGDKGWASQPVWADTDDWYEKQLAAEQLEAIDEELRKKEEKAMLAAQQPDAMQQLEAALE
jgi:peptidyl-prolyl isomerase E (cyclophilin E)